jgi:predicted GNAT superfamily acetyltransferase
MIYRMRTYQAIPEKLRVFHRYFHDFLEPIYTRHGVVTVGRWETEDAQVIAIFGYASRDEYERVTAAVNADPAMMAALEFRASVDPLWTTYDDVFMTSTS